MNGKWPKEAPVCMHDSWGIVTITGVDLQFVLLDGREQLLVEVCSDRLRQLKWTIHSYATRAWPEHLTPLTPAAREMLAAQRDAR